MTNNNVNISQRFFVTLLRFCVHTTSSYCIHTYTNITTCTNYVAHSKSAVRVFCYYCGGLWVGLRCTLQEPEDAQTESPETIETANLRQQNSVRSLISTTVFFILGLSLVFFSGDLHLLQSKGLCWNRFRTSQGPCRANLHKWGLAQSSSCDCGQRQSMNHIVDTSVGKFINKT